MIITIFVMNKREERTKLEKSTFQALGTFVLCIFFLYFIILSGTRACLIAIGVIYAIVLAGLFRTKRKSTQMIALLVGVISILTLSSMGARLLNAIMEAHGGEALAEDNRYSIWSGYIESLWNHPDVMLFGVGMNSCSVYGEVMELGNPHNVIIEKVTECGLIGVILNFFIFYPLVKRKRMSFMTPETLPFYTWLSTLMVYGSSGSDMPYLLLALIIEKREVEKNENYTNFSDG